MMQSTIDTVIVPSLFEGLSTDDAASILSNLPTRHFIQGQYIFETGQPATCLFLIQAGLVKVSYLSPDGDNKILDIFECGDIFGELFLGDVRYRIGQAYAMTDATVYCLTEQDLYSIIHHYPTVSLNFMRHLVNSQRRTMTRMHALQQTDARTRLLGTLLYMTRHLCCTQNGLFELDTAITQQDLADMTGLNRSTVSSLINKLRQEEILGGTGRQLQVNKQRIEDMLWNSGFELLE